MQLSNFHGYYATESDIHAPVLGSETVKYHYDSIMISERWPGASESLLSGGHWQNGALAASLLNSTWATDYSLLMNYNFGGKPRSHYRKSRRRRLKSIFRAEGLEKLGEIAE